MGQNETAERANRRWEQEFGMILKWGGSAGLGKRCKSVLSKERVKVRGEFSESLTCCRGRGKSWYNFLSLCFLIFSKISTALESMTIQFPMFPVFPRHFLSTFLQLLIMFKYLVLSSCAQRICIVQFTFAVIMPKRMRWGISCSVAIFHSLFLCTCSHVVCWPQYFNISLHSHDCIQIHTVCRFHVPVLNLRSEISNFIILYVSILLHCIVQ
jgi:hypothetical protein